MSYDKMKANHQNLSLRWDKKKTLNLFLLNFIALIIIFSLVYLNPYIFIRGKPGTSVFFILYPFIIEFVTLWGIWGIISSYSGVAAGLLLISNFKPFNALILAFIYIVPAAISFAIYRRFVSFLGLDPLKRDLLNSEIEGTKTKRLYAWIFFLMFEAILLNVIQVSLGLYYLNLIGFFSKSEAVFWFYVWSFSNFVSCLIIEPILIKTMTENLKEFGLVNAGWMS
ncbi:MAG: hypothetical protein ACP5LF_04520 [Nitrososphaeria archaeon]